jgi:hypothetical protein
MSEFVDVLFPVVLQIESGINFKELFQYPSELESYDQLELCSYRYVVYVTRSSLDASVYVRMTVDRIVPSRTIARYLGQLARLID